MTKSDKLFIGMVLAALFIFVINNTIQFVANAAYFLGE